MLRAGFAGDEPELVDEAFQDFDAVGELEIGGEGVSGVSFPAWMASRSFEMLRRPQSTVAAVSERGEFV